MKRLLTALAAAMVVAAGGSAQAGQDGTSFFAEWWAENYGDEPLPWWAGGPSDGGNSDYELNQSLKKN